MSQDTFPSLTCTTRDAASRLGISVRTAQLWVEEGRLRAWKTPGGHRRILQASVDSLLAEQKQAGLGEQSRFSILVLRELDEEGRALCAVLDEVVPGCVVDLAGNGFEGLIRIGEQAPEVLITDLGLSGLDFFRMAATLAEHARTRSMLVIVLVASEADRQGVRARLPGDVVLMKTPVDKDELAALLRAFRRQWMVQRETLASRVEETR